MIRRLLSMTGYLLYTLLVLIILLWWKFPAGTVKTWLEQQLNSRSPGYVWKIESLKPVLPDHIRLTGISVIPVQRQKQQKQTMPLLHVEQLDLIPDPVRILSKSKLIRYRMRLFSGTGEGRLVSSSNFHSVELNGRFEKLQIKQMKALRTSLRRKLTGTVTGDFSWQGDLQQKGKTQISGRVVIVDGILPFRKPILGMTSLPYTKIETGCIYQGGKWLLKKGKLISTRLTATFSGRIDPAGTIASSGLQLNGVLTPRSELFSGNGRQQMAGMIRSFLKDGGLAFTVSGTAAEPGINFANGLSRAMDRLQGNRR